MLDIDRLTKVAKDLVVLVREDLEEKLSEEDHGRIEKACDALLRCLPEL
jgi:hypothetical protein